MILPRVMTAVILAPLVLAAIWYGSIPFFVFGLGVSCFCLWEFCSIADRGGFPNRVGMGFFGTIAVLLAFFLDGSPLWGPVQKSPAPLFVFIAWFFFLFLREIVTRDKSTSFLRIITTATGVIMAGVLLGHMVLLRDLRVVVGEGFQFIGREVVFFLFIVVWSVDIGAWVVGRLIGKAKMAPLISPNKSWEGALGGTLFALFTGWICREAFLNLVFNQGEAVFYAGCVAVAAQVSDLSESLMKRSFNVKDSSEILPGHGGILDRFDSFIFSAPFLYYILLGTGRFL